jgi:hypothetical protein
LGFKVNKLFSNQPKILLCLHLATDMKNYFTKSAAFAGKKHSTCHLPKQKNYYFTKRVKCICFWGIYLALIFLTENIDVDFETIKWLIDL